MTSPLPLPPHQDPVPQENPYSVSIMEYVTTLVAQLDRRLDTLHEDLKDSIAERFDSATRHGENQRAVLLERLRGIDRASELLSETVNRVPTDLQREIKHLRELNEERFDSVQVQFKERDTRSERESRDNKTAVDAAFSAQKEAASEQNKSNTTAIIKSEQSTAEQLSKLVELFRTGIDALSKEVASLDRRLTSMESVRQGGKETVAGIYAFTGFLVTLLVLVGVLAAAGVFK